MNWTKLKKTIEDRFADNVKGSVRLQMTRYTIASSFTARGWITVNGKEIANFSTAEHLNRFGNDAPPIALRIPDEERTSGRAVEKGEFSFEEFLSACNFMLNAPIEEALASDHPLIRGLALLDRRVGKRRLSEIEADKEHPLVKELFRVKTETETASKC